MSERKPKFTMSIRADNDLLNRGIMFDIRCEGKLNDYDAVALITSIVKRFEFSEMTRTILAGIISGLIPGFNLTEIDLGAIERAVKGGETQ